MPCWCWCATLKSGAAVTMNKALMVLVMLGATGCSNKAVYDNMRINQRNECIKEPPAGYFECIERTQKTYDEYERERKELLEKAVTNGKGK